MTKTLTKQWKDGELPREFYYIRDRRKEVYLSCLIDYKTEKGWVKEVLAPVPSYEEYRELLDLNVYEKDRKKVMGLEDKVKRLQEQIKEANDIIQTLYKRKECDAFDHLIFRNYLEKWGVK
jgi:hypothetical protein